MRASWCACRARFGITSAKRIPVNAVRIGRSVPRISAGASGLGSNESIWLTPPAIQSKMTDFAGADPGAGAVLALALGPAIAGNARKAIPSAPTRSKSRRLQRELQAVGQVRWKANGTRPMNTYSGKGGIVSADEPDCKKLPTY